MMGVGAKRALRLYRSCAPKQLGGGAAGLDSYDRLALAVQADVEGRFILRPRRIGTREKPCQETACDHK